MTDQPITQADLKPCPFCGGSNAYSQNVRNGRRVGCPDCGARSGSEYHGPSNDTELRAITAWNTRSDEATRPLVEALERIAETHGKKAAQSTRSIARQALAQHTGAQSGLKAQGPNT